MLGYIRPKKKEKRLNFIYAIHLFSQHKTFNYFRLFFKRIFFRNYLIFGCLSSPWYPLLFKNVKFIFLPVSVFNLESQLSFEVCPGILFGFRLLKNLPEFIALFSQRQIVRCVFLSHICKVGFSAKRARVAVQNPYVVRELMK